MADRRPGLLPVCQVTVSGHQLKSDTTCFHDTHLTSLSSAWPDSSFYCVKPDSRMDCLVPGTGAGGSDAALCLL